MTFMFDEEGCFFFALFSEFKSHVLNLYYLDLFQLRNVIYTINKWEARLGKITC